ncbi:MAG: hypothetical protein COA45_11725 [Zetaproteobacteria bacterium]|nr:MAG: hypothetical protein COA45_11725 [Zetaproteobacteria bacterium]
MSIRGSLKGILSGVAGAAMMMGVGVTDVSAQTDDNKSVNDSIMQSVETIEKNDFYKEHGYDRAVKKNVKVNFASHFPSGQAITQSMYEIFASTLQKSGKPQVVMLIVRDSSADLDLREGNRFSNTAYEQKMIDMARNVGNSFSEPDAKVVLAFAVAQEEKIKTSPGDILFYINDRVDYYSPASDRYKGLSEDRFIREVAMSLGHEFSTGRYKLSQQQVFDTLDAKTGDVISRDTTSSKRVSSSSGSGDTTGDTGGDAGAGTDVAPPVLLVDNSM